MGAPRSGIPNSTSKKRGFDIIFPIYLSWRDPIEDMATISQPRRLERVEHILGSGNGVLDFAVDGQDDYLTWWGDEDADWTVEDVDRIENTDEDRFIIFPEGDYFVCEIEAQGEEHNSGPVRCWSEE